MVLSIACKSKISNGKDIELNAVRYRNLGKKNDFSVLIAKTQSYER